MSQAAWHIEAAVQWCMVEGGVTFRGAAEGSIYLGKFRCWLPLPPSKSQRGCKRSGTRHKSQTTFIPCWLAEAGSPFACVTRVSSARARSLAASSVLSFLPLSFLPLSEFLGTPFPLDVAGCAVGRRACMRAHRINCRRATPRTNDPFHPRGNK